MSDYRLRAQSSIGAAAGAFGRPASSSGDGSLVLHERFPIHAAEIAAYDAFADVGADFAALTGVSPPAPGRVEQIGEASILNLGPNRWAVISTQPIQLQDNDALAVTDLGSARALITLSGQGAAAVLAKGTSIDLHPAAFNQGYAAVTRLGHIALTVWRAEDGFNLLVAKSYALSLCDWLKHAGQEFGGRAEFQV
jgi:sarcosine oxidase subunit gamma